MKPAGIVTEKKSPGLRLKSHKSWSVLRSNVLHGGTTARKVNSAEGKEHMQMYTIAIVLHTKPTNLKTQTQIVSRLRDAGIDVLLLRATSHTKEHVIVLCRATSEALGRTAEALGASADHTKYFCACDVATLSYAAVKQVLDELDQAKLHGESNGFHRADAFAGAGTSSSLRNDVAAMFPLHDREWNKAFHEKYTLRGYVSDYLHGRNSETDPRIDSLRLQFGEQCAFYFAFMDHYIKWILPITIFGFSYYALLRTLDWGYYIRGLGFFGFSLPCIWGPLFVNAWGRRDKQLTNRWRTPQAKIPTQDNAPTSGSSSSSGKGLETAMPAAMLSPAAILRATELPLCLRPVRESLADEDLSRRRCAISALSVALIVLNVIVLVCVYMPFMQWFVFAKMAPLCSDCPDCREFVNCFTTVDSALGTRRWLYIFIQGVLMGLLIDVAQFAAVLKLADFLTNRELWATKEEWTQALVQKEFGYMWLNWFLWYLFLALVYVPFGGVVQEFLVSHGFGIVVPGHDGGLGWTNGIIAMDQMFVTPLIITQLLNLVAKTWIPHILLAIDVGRKEEVRLKGFSEEAIKQASFFIKSVCPRTGRTLLIANALRAQGVDDDEAREETPLRSAASRLFGNGGGGGDIKILLKSDDRNRYDAVEVLAQSATDAYDPHDDQRYMVIQIGYTIMFSICWPLAPFCALINNIFERWTDSFKLLHNKQRPLPYCDNGLDGHGVAGIGEWNRMIVLEVLLAVPVTAALLVWSTGELDYWKDGCEDHLAPMEEMGIDRMCIDARSRLSAFFVLTAVGEVLAGALLACG